MGGLEEWRAVGGLEEWVISGSGNWHYRPEIGHLRQGVSFVSFPYSSSHRPTVQFLALKWQQNWFLEKAGLGHMVVRLDGAWCMVHGAWCMGHGA